MLIINGRAEVVPGSVRVKVIDAETLKETAVKPPAEKAVTPKPERAVKPPGEHRAGRPRKRKTEDETPTDNTAGD